MNVNKKILIFKTVYKVIFYIGICLGAVFSILKLNFIELGSLILIVYLNEKVIKWNLKKNKSNYYALLVLSILGMFIFVAITAAMILYNYLHNYDGFGVSDYLEWFIIGLLIFGPPFVFLIQKDVRQYLKGQKQ